MSHDHGTQGDRSTRFKNIDMIFQCINSSHFFRPQSLGSALPSHHSNSYPSNNYPSNSYSSNSIDDHVDVDTNEQPEGMFETTFDVSGEVKTYTSGHREAVSYQIHTVISLQK